MRVAVVVVFVSVLSTPSEASQSCMSKTEARQSFHSSHIYWHGAEHCWDATPIRRHGGQHRAHHHEPEPTPPAVLPMPSPDLRRSGADSHDDLFELRGDRHGGSAISDSGSERRAAHPRRISRASTAQ